MRYANRRIFYFTLTARTLQSNERVVSEEEQEEELQEVSNSPVQRGCDAEIRLSRRQLHSARRAPSHTLYTARNYNNAIVHIKLRPPPSPRAAPW